MTSKDSETTKVKKYMHESKAEWDAFKVRLRASFAKSTNKTDEYMKDGNLADSVIRRAKRDLKEESDDGKTAPAASEIDARKKEIEKDCDKEIYAALVRQVATRHPNGHAVGAYARPDH